MLGNVAPATYVQQANIAIYNHVVTIWSHAHKRFSFKAMYILK